MRVDTFIEIVESSKAQSPADRDGKIDSSEMAATFAAIESAEKSAERNGQLFFDEDAQKWKIR